MLVCGHLKANSVVGLHEEVGVVEVVDIRAGRVCADIEASVSVADVHCAVYIEDLRRRSMVCANSQPPRRAQSHSGYKVGPVVGHPIERAVRRSIAGAEICASAVMVHLPVLIRAAAILEPDGWLCRVRDIQLRPGSGRGSDSNGVGDRDAGCVGGDFGRAAIPQRGVPRAGIHKDVGCAGIRALYCKIFCLEC